MAATNRLTDPVGAGPLYQLEPPANRYPYDIFERYRAHAPVRWEPAIEAFVVSRYDDIVSVLRQPVQFSTKDVLGPVLERQQREIVAALIEEEPEVAELVAQAARDQRGGVLHNADPPIHSRQRTPTTCLSSSRTWFLWQSV
jgi:cytochrome P450